MVENPQNNDSARTPAGKSAKKGRADVVNPALGTHELAVQVRAWIADTPARNDEAKVIACIQAYMQALYLHCDTRQIAEQDLLERASLAGVSNLARVHALFFLAHQLKHRGYRQNHRLLLSAALSVMISAGLYDLLAGPVPAMGRLCEEALEADIAPELVTRLIRQHRLMPESPFAPDWPWRVRVYTLGRFAVVCEGQQLSFNGKSPRKALELLQALIAHGGRDVHISLLMQSLWPEESNSNLQNLFDNTLHRLRRIVGLADVLHVQNAKLTLDSDQCWVDAWCFNRLTANIVAEPLAPTSSRKDLSDREARTAWRLYTGHFLQTEVDTAWALPHRERLRNRFHRLVRILGARMEEALRWEDAIEVYERGVEIDNLAEILYQHLMFCYQQLGEHAEALRVYRRCRELLSIVLNVAPSARTELLRQVSAVPPR